MKKDVSNWRPVGLHERPGLTVNDLDALADVLSLPTTGDAREAFRQHLGGIANWYWVDEAWRSAPAPSDVRRKLESIRKAARRLTAQFGVLPLPDEDVETLDVISHPIRSSLTSAAERYGEAIGGYSDYPPMAWRMRGQPEQHMDYHGDSKLAAAIEHVQLIGAWCERAIQSTRQKQDGDEIERAKRYGGSSRHARNPGNEPLNDLIGKLGGLYRITTGTPPGIARPSSGRGRPGGPFVRFVLAVCKRMEIPLTASALEKRWRTVGPLVHAGARIEPILDRIERDDEHKR